MASENPFWPPKHLASQPRAIQIGTLLIGPILAGIVCGWLLGESKTGYLIATTVLILGGLAAGYEHDTLKGGALRGLWGGLVFGATIAATHAIIGGVEKADVPHPVILLAVLFGAISTVLGVIGAAIKRRHVRGAAGPAPS
jgi:hypothetical protein